MTVGRPVSEPADREPRRIDLWSGRLRVAALAVPGTDVVAARAWLRGGARVASSPGLALLTGRMLVEGTRSRSWREIAEDAEGRGVAVDGSASAEVHGVTVDALADDALLALKWLVELLLEPAFPMDRFELLRDQTVGDLHSMADRPDVVTGWAFRDQLYHPHPLAAPSRGTGESLAALMPEDCRQFHRIALERGGVVAVAGAIDEQEVLDGLERLLGDAAPADAVASEPLPSGLVSAAADAGEGRAPAPPGRPERRIEVATRSRDQAQVCAGHFTVERRHPDLPELRALGILLGSDGLAGLIPHRVREQEGLAYAAHVDTLAGAGTDRGALSVSLGTRPRNVERALELVQESLREVLETPPADSTLDECKQGMIGREAFAGETAAARAGLLVDSLLFDLPSHRRSFRRERIERLTPRGVHEAARRHIDPDRLHVVVGLPSGPGSED